jgi:hypothetical protein
MTPLELSLNLFEPLRYQFHIPSWRPNSTGRFLLKGVQNVDNTGKSHCINSAIRVASEVIHNFEDAGSGSLPRLGARMLPSKLRHAQGGPDFALNFFGESREIGQTAGDPNQRFFARCSRTPAHELS